MLLVAVVVCWRRTFARIGWALKPVEIEAQSSVLGVSQGGIEHLRVMDEILRTPTSCFAERPHRGPEREKHRGFWTM